MRLAALVALVVLGTGCIALHGGEARKIAPFPPAEFQPSDGQKRELALDLTFQSEGGVTPGRTTADAASEIGRAVIEKSGAFTYVANARSAAYGLNLQIREEGNPNVVMGVLCTLTLGLVPWWTTSTFTIRAELHGRSGKLGERTIRQTMTVVGQTLLLFAMPFYWPGTASETMWRDAMQDLVAWSHDTIEATVPRMGGRPERKRAE